MTKVRHLRPEELSWTAQRHPALVSAEARATTQMRHLRPEKLSWTAQRHPALVSAGARAATQIWTWPEVPTECSHSTERLAELELLEQTMTQFEFPEMRLNLIVAIE